MQNNFAHSVFCKNLTDYPISKEDAMQQSFRGVMCDCFNEIGDLVLNKIEEIRRKRKLAHSTLLSLRSKVYKKFLKMEEAAYVDGALKKKDKELIAVGIAVATNCESCMEWHITAAVKSGATFREVLEAIEVGIEFGGGRATVSARFALEVMDHLSREMKR